MVKFFSKRRLKIAEQIIVVSFFAVLIPMIVSGVIINNINQQSNRAQLRSAAVTIANIVAEEIDIYEQTIYGEIKQMAETLEYYNSPEQENNYIEKMTESMPFYKDVSIINDISQMSRFKQYQNSDDYFLSKYQMKDGRYIVAVLDLASLRKNLFKTVAEDKRQIYVINQKTNELVASSNFSQEGYETCLKQLPGTLVEDKAIIYGESKNKPLVYLKKSNPKALILVNTTDSLKRTTIDYNRDRIILSILISILTIFFVVGLYTSYLYINIKQLFKAIIAISKGNYARRIRLLTNIFTPFEIVFLGTEFNKMVSQIHKSYVQLKKKNKELKQLNEFRSNMIDTVSHEFRTPLTSIQGYTSRLLRKDIEIDEDTRQKSLKIIKRQSERLKRMIEDLLVIPDIEGARLNFNMQPLALNSVIESSIVLVKNDSGREIINNTEDCTIEILADNDRIEQVFVNLIENAVKYAPEGTPITIDYETEQDKVVVSVKNEYDLIPREKLKTLFDKFSRIDDKTTRTTRGTGLGLYIVKGLVEAMNGEIRLYSNEEYGFCAKVFISIA